MEKRQRQGRHFALPVSAVAVLACAMLALGVGVGALIFSSSSHTVQFTALVPGASARLEIGHDESMLVATGLPAAKGRVYHVWLKKGETLEPTNTLFLPRGDGSATASVPGSLDSGDTVLVTAEPEGGSPMPTSNPVLAAEMT